MLSMYGDGGSCLYTIIQRKKVEVVPSYPITTKMLKNHGDRGSPA